MIKGYKPKTKKVHDMIKKGYTKSHIANSRLARFKGNDAPQQIGQQDNDNNAKSMKGSA